MRFSENVNLQWAAGQCRTVGRCESRCIFKVNFHHGLMPRQTDSSRKCIPIPNLYFFLFIFIFIYLFFHLFCQRSFSIRLVQNNQRWACPPQNERFQSLTPHGTDVAVSHVVRCDDDKTCDCPAAAGITVMQWDHFPHGSPNGRHFRALTLQTINSSLFSQITTKPASCHMATGERRPPHPPPLENISKFTLWKYMIVT